jgi:acyl-coenzyme A synthetase/AMP-(fatty) acid ligase
VSKIIKQLRVGSADKKAGNRVFLCLEDLLAFYGRMTPGRKAILAPECGPVTYGALWAHVNDTVRRLRSLGIGRRDRVAVVLPNGPESTVAMIAVAAGAVCVPLNPGFTVDEWQVYFGDLRVTALLTGRFCRLPVATITIPSSARYGSSVQPLRLCHTTCLPGWKLFSAHP